jgi:hypothetical protein
MEKPRFDPDKVAYYEKAGWEAYYDRNWLRVFSLMVGLNREQFRMPLLTALAASIDVVRASLAFAPLEGNDVPAATAYLRRYYAKARRSVGIAADAGKLAELEMDYWVVHRQLAMERKQNPTLQNWAPMTDSLERLHAALFAAPAAAVRTSAEQRALAAVAVDRITGGYSRDVATDWRAVEEHLRAAYGALVIPNEGV